jgi:phospholipase C
MKKKAKTRPRPKPAPKPKPAAGAGGPIEHVVIIVKENHGYDNYFGPFPGGNGATMPHSPNPPPKDPDHRHAAWLARDTKAPHVQFQKGDIAHYWSYASQFTLCDNYFTDVAGPSTPNHLMLIMADSPLVDNPSKSYRTNPGPPLYDKPSLPAQLDKAGHTWGNYNGYAFQFIKYTAGKNKKTSQQFAIDAAAGKLPTVSWLYADHALSEHPADKPADLAAGVGDVTKGSDWTASQVQAIVKAGLWPNVAIFITWDDWGGWWDHVTPPNVEKWTDGTQFRYGGRVGCLVLSAYARKGYISKARHSHVSLLKFCENNFGLPSLNARTTASDGMEDCFDFKQTPLPPPQ